MSRRFAKNFGVDEVACKSGTPVPTDLYPNMEEVCRRAQILRDFVDSPLRVNSGYRTPDYNAKVGGVKNSWHMKAGALDLHHDRWTAAQLADIYEGLIRIGAVPDGGLGRYGTFIHIDIGPTRRWHG